MRFKLILLFYVLTFTACDNGDGSSNVGGSLSDTIVASIVVNELPSVLTVDYQATDNNYTEYKWEVVFDMNEDGELGESDIVFQISEHKVAGETERTVRFSDLEAQLLVYTGINQLLVIGEIDFTVAGNKLSFIVDRSLHADLLQIDSQTQVRVETYINTPDTLTVDYLPSFDMYTQVQDNSSILDDTNDYIGDDARFDIQRFELQIID
jgi:hypothetical protein